MCRQELQSSNEELYLIFLKASISQTKISAGENIRHNLVPIYSKCTNATLRSPPTPYKRKEKWNYRSASKYLKVLLEYALVCSVHNV
jgi:hypothetical protein